MCDIARYTEQVTDFSTFHALYSLRTNLKRERTVLAQDSYVCANWA